MASAQPSDPQRKLVRTNEQGRFNPELVPDPVYYSPGDLVTVPETQSRVFSSRNRSVVGRHLNIMAQHKIDGVFLTRRGDEASAFRRIAAAYQGGKGLGVMKYDLAGMPSHQLEQWVTGDWEFMINQKHVLDSPAYVHEHGRPVIAIWGVGFKNANQDPQAVLNLIHKLSEMSGGAYIILGGMSNGALSVRPKELKSCHIVPVTWQKQDNSWQTVYKMADALAPLSVGALVDEESANNWSKDVQQPAIQSLRGGSKKVDYVSVVWPGHEGQLMRNGMSAPSAARRDGAFLWRQVYNAHRDGFDDGTALLPSIGATQSGTPSDWYLRICGYASEALKGEKHLYEDLPRKELAEYWGTRPHYEERQQEEPGSSPGGGASAGASASGGASGSGGGLSLAPPVRAPTRSMTADFGDAPPPYTLEPQTPAAANSGAAVFTAEPESVPPAPVSSSSQIPYQSDRPGAPTMNRVDPTHSTASSSVHPQQHRPGPISVPDPTMNAIPVQPPGGYPGPCGYPGMGMGLDPSSPPATNTPLQRADSASAGGAYGRPPQHPAAASRPPPVAPTRPPARPQSSGHSSPPGSYPTLPTSGGVHQLTDQMQGMNVGGPNRPAPEHVFAGIGLGTPQRPSMPGMPASPFEGINMPGRPGQGPGPGVFGPQPPLPPRHPGQYGPGHDAPPQTPSTPGSIPGSPFYPGPLQHGHGPAHQHAPGPTHQATLGPTHQPTLGPTHQHTVGPTHQGSTSPGHNYPSPAHQATLGPSQPGQPPRPGQPPQPSFQPSGPYIPHHQSTGRYTPQGAPQQGYFGQPHRQDSSGYAPHSGGYQSPPPQQPGGYSASPQPPGGWHPPQPAPAGYPSIGSAGQSPQPQHGPPLHSGGGQGSHPGSAGHSPHMGGPPPQPQGPYPGYGQYPPGGQHPGARPGMPGGQYVDSALGIVGKYAGEDTKKKLEAGVAGALSGSWNKVLGSFKQVNLNVMRHCIYVPDVLSTWFVEWVGRGLFGSAKTNMEGPFKGLAHESPCQRGVISSTACLDKPLLPPTTMEGFTSYVVRSFVPKTFGRLCVLGVDLVGVPVLLLYGLPEIRYLESRGDKVPTSNMRVFELKVESPADSVAPSLAVTEGTVSPLTCEDLEDLEGPVRCQSPAQDESICEEAQLSEQITGVEFPRTEIGLEEIPADVNTRTARTISLSSTDSNTTCDSECLTTPPQIMVELPAESDNMDESAPTPRPDGVQRFSVFQDERPEIVDLSDSWANRSQFLDADAGPTEISSPRRPPTRKKSTKYGSCPLLVPKRSNPSLHLSEVTYDKPVVFTA
ncbi:hypothetical protein FRC10_009664 [Ceratobasidium sp. 414]|nr:hypothetical protein FRC10_009664 [Ceratobasidium sp. 414]